MYLKIWLLLNFGFIFPLHIFYILWACDRNVNKGRNVNVELNTEVKCPFETGYKISGQNAHVNV